MTALTAIGVLAAVLFLICMAVKAVAWWDDRLYREIDRDIARAKKISGRARP